MPSLFILWDVFNNGTSKIAVAYGWGTNVGVIIVGDVFPVPKKWC